MVVAIKINNNNKNTCVFVVTTLTLKNFEIFDASKQILRSDTTFFIQLKKISSDFCL